MNQPVPIHDCNSLLQKRIDEKIAEIRAVEKNLPCAIIIHDIRDSTVVYMSEKAANGLGTRLKELREMGTEYHTKFFNPEDAKDYLPKILGLLERNNDDEIVSFFQQVRKSPQDGWNWYLSSIKIILRDDHTNPILTLTTSIPLDAQHHIAAKAERLLEENNFLRRNYHLFSQLTRREKEILRRMALGQSSLQIAEELHISEATANTHRRNIRQKINAITAYDITRFAQAFDLI
jgi:DNA-binding CsgD family transcriptional regulator